MSICLNFIETISILLTLSPIKTPICFLHKKNIVKFVNFPISIGIEPKKLFLPTSLSDRLQKDQGNIVLLNKDRLLFGKIVHLCKKLDFVSNKKQQLTKVQMSQACQ